MRWICNPGVPGSSPPPCHWMDLWLVVSNSTPPRFVNNQLVSFPPVGIFNKILFNLQQHFDTSIKIFFPQPSSSKVESGRNMGVFSEHFGWFLLALRTWTVKLVTWVFQGLVTTSHGRTNNWLKWQTRLTHSTVVDNFKEYPVCVTWEILLRYNLSTQPPCCHFWRNLKRDKYLVVQSSNSSYLPSHISLNLSLENLVVKEYFINTIANRW